jgi:lysyl-tRNA synthetase class 1
MAEHFILEFFSVFGELGIRPEFYRMRDIYRSGRFNQAIDAILRKADVVRRIYKEVSGSDRPDNWHPFQTICENCGRIGTTVVTAYDGKEVTYECRPDLVKWAVGCGHRGKVSPFDGKGKLPWKLEWCAKWLTFPVTIEGAGQDHSTKGGSRDVAMACLREIFGKQPPLNCPYDFFLVGGAKMSSSKGVGVTSRDMADFLPPELLRFLLIRPPPRQPVNFEPSEVYIIKLFNEFDRAKHKYFHDDKSLPGEKRVYELSEVNSEPDYWTGDFQLVTALTQMPHLDVVRELEKRKGSPFTGLELHHLQQRIRAALYWVERYATEEEKTRLQETLPARAQTLTAAQRGFLHILAKLLPHTKWEGDALQVCLFSAARLTPIEQPLAFKAVYRVLLDRENGPKAGNFLSFLNQDFVVRRCLEMPFDKNEFLKETAVDKEAVEKWLQKEKPNITGISARQETNSAGQTYTEFLVTMSDGKTHARRVSLGEPDARWLHSLEAQSGLKISPPSATAA